MAHPRALMPKTSATARPARVDAPAIPALAVDFPLTHPDPDRGGPSPRLSAEMDRVRCGIRQRFWGVGVGGSCRALGERERMNRANISVSISGSDSGPRSLAGKH